MEKGNKGLTKNKTKQAVHAWHWREIQGTKNKRIKLNKPN